MTPQAPQTLTEPDRLQIVGASLTDAVNALASLCGVPAAVFIIRCIADRIEREDRERVVN